MKWLTAILLLIATCQCFAAGMDEVNFWRSRVGLRAFREDPQLTAFAQTKAEYRAKRLLQNGHQGPRWPAGTREGTGETNESWGCWNTCVMEETGDTAGAGVARGRDGQRYMVLVVRGGGAAPIGRNIRWVRTFHLTPNPPVMR